MHTHCSELHASSPTVNMSRGARLVFISPSAGARSTNRLVLPAARVLFPPGRLIVPRGSANRPLWKPRALSDGVAGRLVAPRGCTARRPPHAAHRPASTARPATRCRPPRPPPAARSARPRELPLPRPPMDSPIMRRGRPALRWSLNTGHTGAANCGRWRSTGRNEDLGRSCRTACHGSLVDVRAHNYGFPVEFLEY